MHIVSNSYFKIFGTIKHDNTSTQKNNYFQQVRFNQLSFRKIWIH